MFHFRNLLSNPFMCNCHLAWFAEWLRSHELTAGGPKCAGPPRVKDSPIHELPHHEFQCTSNTVYFLQIYLKLYYNLSFCMA